MNMINASNDTIRVPVELFHADSWDGPEARPNQPVPVEPGEVVLIDDHYALRTRGPKAEMLKSAVEKTCPQLKPCGAEALELYTTKTVDDLDDVRRTFAELERVARAQPGTIDQTMLKAQVERGIREGISHALGLDQPKPTAKPRIEKAPQEDWALANAQFVESEKAKAAKAAKADK